MQRWLHTSCCPHAWVRIRTAKDRGVSECANRSIHENPQCVAAGGGSGFRVLGVSVARAQLCKVSVCTVNSFKRMSKACTLLPLAFAPGETKVGGTFYYAIASTAHPPAWG